jgi:hypothetical protein
MFIVYLSLIILILLHLVGCNMHDYIYVYATAKHCTLQHILSEAERGGVLGRTITPLPIQLVSTS